MTMKYHYMALVFVIGCGVWAWNQPPDAFRNDGFAGVFDGVADLDDDDDDDEDDDFSDILGKPEGGGDDSGRAPAGPAKR